MKFSDLWNSFKLLLLILWSSLVMSLNILSKVLWPFEVAFEFLFTLNSIIVSEMQFQK